METSFPGYRKARTGFFYAFAMVAVIAAAVAVPAMADGEFMALESDQARQSKARDYCEAYRDFGADAKACENTYMEINFQESSAEEECDGEGCAAVLSGR